MCFSRDDKTPKYRNFSSRQQRILQQDSAPVYKVRITQAWLHNNTSRFITAEDYSSGSSKCHLSWRQ